VLAPRARVAIHLAVKGLIRPGQKVVLSPYTIADVVNVVVAAGGVPVFADIERETCNVDPAEIEKLVDGDTGAVLVTHLHGLACDMDVIPRLTSERGVPLIEDAAQAFGADGVARTGICSTFSFFPTKNLFALGDGGLVTSLDEDTADRIRMLRFHGSRDKRTFELVGVNSRLDAVQAAMLRVFLPRLAGWNAARREAAARYAELGLGELVELPVDEPGHVYHMYVVRTSRRAEIADALTAAGIASASYYVRPTHLQPAMAYLGVADGSLPETERAAAENLALPMWGGIDREQQERVVDAVRSVAGVPA
jgi:dTDP-4-amino-4,6-dideoxygalactose transaminase